MSSEREDRADFGVARYDSFSAEALAARLSLPRVIVYDSIGSTLDVAHALAAQGTPSGTLILADAQTAGRGRMGRSWRSEPGIGIWLTLVERPRDAAALEVLSLRVGLALAPALDAFAGEPVRLKWPNDLYVERGKLAGILTEARWRDGSPEWVAIGVGINVRVPSDEPRAAGLRERVSRPDVLDVAVPRLRAAAACVGPLDDRERRAFAARDLAVGRRCLEPHAGTVRGIDANGELLIDVPSGVVAIRAGSLVLEEET